MNYLMIAPSSLNVSQVSSSSLVAKYFKYNILKYNYVPNIIYTLD